MQRILATKPPATFNNPWTKVRYRLLTICSILENWQQRARQRRQLLALNDHQLQDIGISRADAVGEGSKPFWRT